ncbi:MAG: ribosome small subunit-dependent GTPase A [Clostridia bacterium]|nr:ribosome small subunit-dependent GTPase A [Clostridia bacterium]
MSNVLEGIIVRSLGGFYNVRAEDNNVYACKPRGVFRKKRITPLVGDKVTISHIEDEVGSIDEIHERRNSLVRPPVANIDKLFIVTSVSDPSPNLLVVDKTISAAELNNIEPIVVITKSDLGSDDEIREIYDSVGIKVITCSADLHIGIDEVRAELKDCVSAFTGNSGVGKSTLLNAINKELGLETGETSKKLGRGKHTTRHVELFEVMENSYVADTPGFSTFDIERYDMTDKTLLYQGFREFSDYIGECKFSSCSHTCEKGCAILQAVEDGKIHRSRFDNYCTMYNEVKDIKQWQIQKNV